MRSAGFRVEPMSDMLIWRRPDIVRVLVVVAIMLTPAVSAAFPAIVGEFDYFTTPLSLDRSAFSYDALLDLASPRVSGGRADLVSGSRVGVSAVAAEDSEVVPLRLPVDLVAPNASHF